MAAALGQRLGLGAGELAEVLERLPGAELEGDALPEAWQRPAARAALERYAARKRAIRRLAARGRL
jgi:hypothetical protein